MVNTGHANREFKYILLYALRRVLGAVLAVVALRATMLAYGVEMRVPYQALMIIAGLISLMLFSGRSAIEGELTPRLSSTSLAVIGRWCLVVGILLLLGYATKTSSIFSRKVLFTWFMVTPPLIVLCEVGINILISSVALSAASNKPSA